MCIIQNSKVNGVRIGLGVIIGPWGDNRPLGFKFDPFVEDYVHTCSPLYSSLEINGFTG
jgi:hypothetical protein